jgi:transcriptional regulator with XRE-family HTH domain
MGRTIQPVSWRQPAAPVPVGFWENPTIRRALAAGELGVVARRYRDQVAGPRGRLSQLEFGHLVGLSQAEVSRLERGECRITSVDGLRRFATGLGIPPHLLGVGEQPPCDHDTPADLAADVPELPDLRSADSPKVTAAHLEQVQATVHQLWKLDDRFGGDNLCDLATGELTRVLRLLNHGRYDEETGRRLSSLAGELHRTVGWLSYDANRQARARHHYAEALLLAQLAGDDDLAVAVLALMSQQAIMLGRAREAIRTAQVAQRTGGERISPRLRALLAIREARGWSTAGDRAACEDALRRASEAFAAGTSPADPPWLAFFDQAELHANEALCWMDLRDRERSERLLLQALAAVTPDYLRNRTAYSVYLALAYLDHRDWARASEAGQQALGLMSGQVTSSRTLENLRTLRRELAPHEHQPAVRAFTRQFDQLVG